MEANKNEVTENPNNDIDTIDDINVLTDIYIKEAKEANELSKKLELITQRFTLIRDKITSLRHMQDDKSEDKDELSENEIVEKTKKEKKEPKKEAKKEPKKEAKKEPKKKEVKPEPEPESKAEHKAEPELEEIEKDVEPELIPKVKKTAAKKVKEETNDVEPVKKTKGRKKKDA